VVVGCGFLPSCGSKYIPHPPLQVFFTGFRYKNQKSKIKNQKSKIKNKKINLGVVV
jgi:hypothetical protein